MEDIYFLVVLNYDDFGMVVDGEEFIIVYIKSGMYIDIYEIVK